MGLHAPLSVQFSTTQHRLTPPNNPTNRPSPPRRAVGLAWPGLCFLPPLSARRLPGASRGSDDKATTILWSRFLAPLLFSTTWRPFFISFAFCLLLLLPFSLLPFLHNVLLHVYRPSQPHFSLHQPSSASRFFCLTSYSLPCAFPDRNLIAKATRAKTELQPESQTVSALQRSVLFLSSLTGLSDSPPPFAPDTLPVASRLSLSSPETEKALYSFTRRYWSLSRPLALICVCRTRQSSYLGSSLDATFHRQI